MKHDWADDEFASWDEPGLGGHDLNARLAAHASARLSAFLFTIGNGKVTLVDKSQSYAKDDPYYAPLKFRAEMYRTFIEECLAAAGEARSGNFVMHVDDMPAHSMDFPAFCFQKTPYSRELLLPDVDFFHNAFYAEKYVDHGDFDAKMPKAVFVGSTTGDDPLTAELVHSRRNARIRAAVFFREVADVDFHLPNVVQVDSIATHQAVVDLGITGQPMSWDEQAAYRYLISLDGNGATCARVYGALASNAVLLKYHSDHQLYYFRAMRPWQHYIPITEDAQVIETVVSHEQAETLHRAIARRSREFAHRRLSRIEVVRYTAALLSRYLDRFGEPDDGAIEPTHPFKLDLLLHVAGLGTVWSPPNDWAQRGLAHPIEGFSVIPDADIDPADVAYRGFDASGNASAWIGGGDYCGTTGLGRPLSGCQIRLLGDAADRYRLAVDARFTDGTAIEDAAEGKAVGPALLCGLRVRLTARADHGRGR